MKALAITPLVADSLRLVDAEKPDISQVPNGRGVLVEMLQVGICGTDRELFRGHFGRPAIGEDYLILGHESLGRIVETAPNVPSTHHPGTLVVATVRRPGDSPYDRLLMQDMSPLSSHIERGIADMHGFMAEYYVDDATYLVPVPQALAQVAILAEPMSVVEKGIRQAYTIQQRMKIWSPQRAAVIGAGPIGMLAALALRLRGLDVTVYSRRSAPYANSDLLESAGIAYVAAGETLPLESAGGPYDLVFEASGHAVRLFDAVHLLANNGVLVVSSGNSNDSTISVDPNAFNSAFVSGNKVLVGTVNSAYEDFQLALADMQQAEAQHPGWLGRMLTHRIDGLEQIEAVRDQLNDGRNAIKAYIDVAAMD